MSTIVEWGDGLPVNGIDLCSLQDSYKPINAQAIRDAGFEFAYVKASQYSSTKDNRFDSLVSRLQGAGLRVGAYHFMAHDTDPVVQAEFFHRASGGLGSRPGELPPMADWEYCTPSFYTNKPEAYPLGHPTHCVDFAERFTDSCDGLWYPDNDAKRIQRLTTLYSFPNYCSNHQPALKASTLGLRPLCYASYQSKPASNGKGYQLIPWLPKPNEAPLHKVPAPWERATLVQYSGDRGMKVPGIVGDCDRQVFLGTREEFDLFCGVMNKASMPVSPGWTKPASRIEVCRGE